MTSLPRRLTPWVGIGLIGLGVLWSSQLAPSLIGWGFVLAGFLALLVPERRWPARTPLDGPLLLLAVMGGVSLLVTARPEVTQVQVVRLGAGLAGFYGLANWAIDRVRILQAAVVLVVGGVGLGLLSPVIVDWSRNQTMLIPDSFYELFPLLISDSVHPNIMASLMLLLFPLPLAWFMSGNGAGRKRIGAQLALGVAFLLMGVALLLTKSRGGYIAAALGGVLVMWLSVRKRWALALVLILTLVVIAVGAWLLFGMESQTPDLVERAADPSTWAFRQQVWRAALWMLADFSFTGAGMGLFNDVAALLYAFSEVQSLGAHNLYLQIGVDLGIPGLIAFLAASMLTLWMAGATAKTFARIGDNTLRAVTVGALGGMVALMLHGLMDITVWSTRVAFFPWLMTGLIAALFEVSTREQKTATSDRIAEGE
ncbi:MAG: O-antigen ligase family protein [Chloroflexi bacterium]|nr:O-antigen ligase family protein [Chloroflexota bacterium]